MKKVKTKANAKINFTLDIVGVEKGYHNLNSLVASIDMFDAISVKKRKDDLITLKIKGVKVNCPREKNTAYLAGKLFKEKFHTCGFDIVVNKKIFLGGGLGGSSADIAGVLNALKKLFSINESVKDIADSLGSDSGYMLEGGYAVIKGRGEIIEKINCSKTLFITLIPVEAEVLAKDSYQKYDELCVSYPPVTQKAVELLTQGKIKEFISSLKNDLFEPSKAICSKICDMQKQVEKIDKCFMTGSGATLYLVFDSKRSQRKKSKTLKKEKIKFVECKTI